MNGGEIYPYHLIWFTFGNCAKGWIVAVSMTGPITAVTEYKQILDIVFENWGVQTFVCQCLVINNIHSFPLIKSQPTQQK